MGCFCWLPRDSGVVGRLWVRGDTAEVDVRHRLHDPVKGSELGFLLASVNPKNLLLAASAGQIVGSAQLTFGEDVVVVIIFTVLAGCTVLMRSPAMTITAAAPPSRRAVSDQRRS